jgi:hypothetical protein
MANGMPPQKPRRVNSHPQPNGKPPRGSPNGRSFRGGTHDQD